MKFIIKIFMILFASLSMLNPNYSVYAGSIQTENSVLYVEVDEEKIYYDTLKEAISNATTDAEYKIYLLKDIEINSKLSLVANNNVVIDGNGFKITRGIYDGVVYAGSLFDVAAKSKLKLVNITIDSGNNWIFNLDKYNEQVKMVTNATSRYDFISSEENGVVASSYLLYNRGELYLDDVEIMNHYSNANGIIYGDINSVATINDSLIKHCATYGENGTGTVFYGGKANSSAYIYGDTIIEDNFSGTNGGIFRINSDSKVVMNGGKIINNRSFDCNGFVAMMVGANSIFELNGGVISNNSGIADFNSRGSVIYIHKDGRFVMNGGVIEKNITRYQGAIDGKNNGAAIELNGGMIQNNYSVVGDSLESDIALYKDYDVVIGEKFVLNGNIYVEGNLVNNGNINGKVTLNITDSKEETPLVNNGKISGDVVIYYNESDFVDKELQVDNKNIDGNIINCEYTNQILIKFYYNGGVDEKGLTSHGLVSVNADQVPEPIKVTKKGHNVEWYLDEDLTQKWNNEVLIDKSALYAKWIPKEYMITWNIDGKIVKTVTKYGEMIKLPEVVKKDGYDFVGWSNYSENMVMPDNDITFTAEYKISVPKTSDNLLSFVVINLLVCSAIIFYSRKRLYRL